MIDRRSFLAGLAAAAPASGKIRVAMLGTGHSHAAGKRKVLEQDPDYELAGVCEFGPDAEKLFADPSIRLAVVECNPSEAVPWGRRVIAAGKHLHLEKPPGDELAPFRELVSPTATSCWSRKPYCAPAERLFPFPSGWSSSHKPTKAACKTSGLGVR